MQPTTPSAYFTPPPAEKREPSALEKFLAQPDVQRAIDTAKSEGRELCAIQSAWGPCVITRKPTYEEELAFTASSRHTNVTQQAHGAPRLLEAILIYPSLPDLRILRDKHGYQFVDNLVAITLREFGPTGEPDSKKL